MKSVILYNVQRDVKNTNKKQWQDTTDQGNYWKTHYSSDAFVSIEGINAKTNH